MRADSCLQDAWDTGNIQGMTLFPNWYRTRVSSSVLWMFDGVAGAETLRGLTVANFGTATNTDLAGVYAVASCGATSSGTLTLTFAGLMNGDNGPLPAWTWAGTSVDFQNCADLCGNPACGGSINLDLYVDVAACPTAGATVRLGLPTNGFLGSVYDSAGCRAPSGPAIGANHTIQYILKEGPTNAVPGDTVQFTLYYGRPGAGPLSITIFDTLPPYTHFVPGGGTPSPDVGMDPDPGPPERLRWTIPGSLPTAGGPTGAITFSLSVDWGNGDAFEPGSGNVAAPEGARLSNVAQGFFTGAACATAVSNPAQTVVRRFLMWMIGDNDVLFSSAYGLTADEMIYSVYVKNLSTTKTWWDVRIWDTVPPQLDPWCAGCGFEDPCAGWTMTPSGCAAASPGRTIAGASTIATWKLDMPPGFTNSLRWKAQVKASAANGQTAINVLSVQAAGRTGIVGGTGNSGAPANFAHLAAIILPTTYVSFVAYSGDRWAQPDAGDALAMFPLNKKAQFELRALSYVDGWAITGGVSSSIGCFIGDCIGGFVGHPGPCPILGIAVDPSSIAGCKAERIPARYNNPVPGGEPYQRLYKMTSNSPVNWQSQPGAGTQCGDFTTYAPASTLTYTGLIHYFWRNSYNATIQGSGTEMFFMNTGKDPYGSVDITLPTIVHMFKFNYGSLIWDYVRSYDLAGESAACDPTTLLGQEGAYRSVSSQSQLIVWQGYQALSTLGCGCPCNNLSSMMPTRDTGNTIGFAGQTFYGVVMGYGNETKVSLGNVGATAATYKVYTYVPDSTAGPAAIPTQMQGTSGSWLLKGFHIVSAGMFAPLNPRIYNVDGVHFDGASAVGVKVEVESGGPIQLHSGARVFAGWGGGAVLHAVDGNQTGAEFWMHTIYTDGTVGSSPETYCVNVFAPKTGMVIRCDGENGRLETYTTTGPDQAVAFIGFANPGRKMNFTFRRMATGATGNVITQYINAGPEKGYTAPFLSAGVHYAIIAPPVVYAGQSFWLTVVVIEADVTKDDYCGTSAFTSTDPGAKIEGTNMGGYTFGWSSLLACTAVPNENGVKVFVNVTFNKLGIQTLIATDTSDGSIAGVAAINVVGADIKLEKRPLLTVAASSDTVQFRICWSNYSSASGFNFVINDAVPRDTTFLPEAGTWALACGGPAPAVAYSMATTPAVPPAASFVANNPVAGARWLRWTIPVVGVNQTGCACFRVTVN